VEGYRARHEQQLKEQDALNHLLGKYLIYSFNAPKKYPKHPFMEKHNSASDRFTTDKAFQAYAKARYGGRKKK